jgi:pilus assembly protein CpaE
LRRHPAQQRDLQQEGTLMSLDFDNNDGRDRIRVFITGSCEGLSKLREALEHHREIDFVGASEQVRDGAGALTGGHIGCVLHATRGASLPSDDLAAIREHTRAPIVLVASVESASLLEEALEADVADVLLLPQLTENVVFAIRKASHSGRRSQAAAGRKGRIVTVFSPKGGTGKTVTTVNLAASLAKQHGKRALLLDLDLQFGDAAIMLGLEPEKTIHDLVVAPGELDSEKLAGYTTRHACGLEILPAPLRPEDAELVTEAKLARLLEVARESFDLIVVDTSPFFHGPMLATLDRTDELLLLCALDVPTLKNVRLSLQTLDLLSFPPERIRLVLRRTSAKVGMNPKEVEGALERKVAFEVPSDGAVALAVNRGNPMVLADPKAEFSRAIASMAKSLLPSAAPKQQQRKRSFAFGRG